MKIIAILRAIIIVLEALMSLGIVKAEDADSVAKSAVEAAIKNT